METSDSLRFYNGITEERKYHGSKGTEQSNACANRCNDLGVCGVWIWTGGNTSVYMQVFNHDFYVQQAASLQTRDTFITPNRGKIYDANMQVLAESAEVERIVVSPKGVVDETKVNDGKSAQAQQQTLAQILADELSLDYDTVLQKIQKTDSEYEIIAQKVDKDVSKELYEKLEQAGCTGVYSEPDTKRYYQQGAFLSAVLGYVGSDNSGAYGLEAQYNDVLSGTAGRIVRVQNAQNKDMTPDTEQYIPAQDGDSLVLTIDSDIQNFLEKHLKPRWQIIRRRATVYPVS